MPVFPDMRIAAFPLLAALAVASPTAAAEPAATTERIAALERQLATLSTQLSTVTAELAELKTARPAPAPVTAQPVLTLAKGKPTIASADGRSAISVRGLFHFDAAAYLQDGAGPLATDFRRGSFGDATEARRARDLNSGTNFRRARLGVDGKLAGDFDYSLVYEFGGSGAEDSGRVLDLWLQYSGLSPFRFRFGAFSPNVGLEDATSTNAIMFLERASSAEIARSLVGGDGRSAIQAYTNGRNSFGTVGVTGGVSGTSSNPFDEQVAVIGRVAYAPSWGDTTLHLGINGAAVLRPADAGLEASGVRRAVRLRDRPELRVDGTRLIDTGDLEAQGAWSLGLELALQHGPLLIQAEHETIGIDRPGAPDPRFGGWYAQAGWILTGEARRWAPAAGAFDGPIPARPFDLSTGDWGAWEVALRHSYMDLNHHDGVAGGVRGGEQTIWTAALNWYVNPSVRLMLQAQDVRVNRFSPGAGTFGAGALTPPAGVQIGQHLRSLTLRTQLAF